MRVCVRDPHTIVYICMWHPEKNQGVIVYANYTFFYFDFYIFITSLRQYLSLTWNSTSRRGYINNESHYFSWLCFSYGGIYGKISPLPVSLLGKKDYK